MTSPSNHRLPVRKGEWIDRSRPVEFRFEGRAFHGYSGDVLSSALWANRVRLLGRSFKYHRPRGIYSLANHDVNVMVEDGHRTNLRGDVLPISEGLDVRAVNTLGGLAGDVLRATESFSAFLPVGFYYKAFHTPRKLFPFYENQMRKVAGLGKINPVKAAVPTAKDYAFCDLLVVGSGPAGLSGAIAAAECGLRVMVVEEEPRPGGSLAWQWGRGGGSTEHLQGLLEKVTALGNVELRCSTQAAGCYADHWIALVDETHLTKLRARAMLVASGCIEQPAVFQNNDLPGVLLGSAAQRLIRLYAIKPFDRCVVLGAGSDAYRVALDLAEAGVDVATLVDLRSCGEATDLGTRVRAAGIDVLEGHTVLEALPTGGGRGVEGALLSPLDDQGKPLVDLQIEIPCDGIAVSVGWTPTGDVLYQAGARFTYAETVEQFVPRQLPDGVFAAGRVNGLFSLEDQMADGRRAGLEAAKSLGRFDGPVPEAIVHHGPPPSHPYPIFEHKGKKNFVDLDEDLHLADFVNAHQEGYDNIELLKRYTTVGMGPSQGKLSNMNAVRILARLNGKSINETGTTTSRPFHHPVSLETLAGRRFHPLRRTPMHAWHGAAGAEFIHVGAWLRPEYYRARGLDRDEAILDEAINVRQRVGLIDVGTLGKIRVCGPDAVAFLERMYTGRFAKQPTGKIRYGVACDETGVIIEDGVIVRLAEDQFYLTTTSSGAAAFFREMQRWALIWRLDVELIDSTGQLGAMNVAGPQCRELLAPLTDIDLSADAFPYVASRQGRVANVPATVLRVGFVGELGYEIHVPAAHALHVWESLMEAGRSFGIRPFGVEAQRLLRLEKGHLIVSQDTDALTTPYEADVAWSIGKNKPFFVGQRSLAILRKQPATRRLVGISFEKDGRGSLPEECHLVFDGDAIVGRVTSIAKRTTLGYPVGLAYVRPDLAEPGTKIPIRVEGGDLVEATVTPIPFYDSENSRQSLTAR
jgi:sarcosine oxidase subunit alpha